MSYTRRFLELVHDRVANDKPSLVARAVQYPLLLATNAAIQFRAPAAVSSAYQSLGASASYSDFVAGGGQVGAATGAFIAAAYAFSTNVVVIDEPTRGRSALFAMALLAGIGNIGGQTFVHAGSAVAGTYSALTEPEWVPPNP